MLLFSIVCLVFTTFIACGKVAQVHSPFEIIDAAYSQQPGNNTIDVTAYFRKESGDIFLCTASPVELWPVTDYSKSIMKNWFNSEDGGDFAYYSQFLT
jgi:hypothetical protein